MWDITFWATYVLTDIFDERCSYRLHNFHTQHTTVCECFPHFLSPPLKIQLHLVVCNVCQTQTPFSQTTTAALSVRRPCTYTHVCNKHQCCYLSIFTLLSLFWNEKKMWGFTFWATFVLIDIFDEHYPGKRIGRGLYPMSTTFNSVSYQAFERCILSVTLLKGIETLSFWLYEVWNKWVCIWLFLASRGVPWVRNVCT
jgi:hypothetical protein